MASLLIVEDDTTIAELLAAALLSEGYDVVAVAHGRHALDRLEMFDHPHLIITDFMMPVLNGAELLNEMHEHESHRLIPAILMSSMPEPHVRKHVTVYAAFIQKPFHLPHVFETVAKVLEAA